MLNKFLALTALTVSLSATTALAQTAQPGGGAPGGGAPAEWDGAIGSAFYSDTTAGTLRTDAELRTNWSTLSEDDQMVVRNYCARFGMGSAADQAQRTEQMGDAGAAAGHDAGVTTLQAEDQAGQTEQMADTGAAAGQAAGVATDQAGDQAAQTEQMGSATTTATGQAGAAGQVGTAGQAGVAGQTETVPGGPSLHASSDASVEQICDMIETM